VIVPCFNQGEYLAEAVGSVLLQSCQDFEILVADDGSTDPQSVAVLETFARPKTTLYRRPHCGLAGTRNFLVGEARGQYLCALDCDDRLHPDFLSRTSRVLDDTPDLTFVSTRLKMFGAADDLWPRTLRCDLPALLAEDTVITAALVRREAVVAVGGYDANMPHQGDEDWDLWISLVEAGHRGEILPDVLFEYRRRPGSLVERCTRGATHLELAAYLIEKHRGSYERHLHDVLLWKTEDLRSLLQRNAALEHEMFVFLTRAIELKQHELHRLQAKLRDPIQAAHTEELERMKAAYDNAVAEVRALRSSVSWRLTSPLRRVYDFLRVASD
jgi:glycosyltransferase involved in cell wall biosynthesis